jgi:tRNA-specific 2-thiouridylase
MAAALLVEQGYDVVGVMLRLWSEPGSECDNRCCTPEAANLARRVAAQLGIRFYLIDAADAFYQRVVQSFIEGYARGVTPNPCISCNRFIRWGFLLDRAEALGADSLATGHYARLNHREDGRVELLRGCDPGKDQSYVLSALTQSQLARTRFPLGEMLKSEVRETARRFDLPVADRQDSQDLCFLAGSDYRPFLEHYAPEAAQPGSMVDRQGDVVGEHSGLACYTIGQRKGLGLAKPQPWYVLEKDIENNRLVVGPVEQLGGQLATLTQINWILGEAPQLPLQAEVKIRYKAPAVRARIESGSDGTVLVQFEQAMRDITPGQLAVFYNGDAVIGSGTITA